MRQQRFKKDDTVLYLDIKAKVISFNKKDWYYTIQTLDDNRIFNCLPSQLASYILEED